MKAFRVFALCAVVCISMSVMAQKSTKSGGNAVRGKYLATQTGLCQDCHSPRDQQGQYVQEKWLQGAPIMFTPSIEIPWAGTAPPIAGLEGWTDEQAIKFLTTGIDKDGKHPRPPMPEYRFNRTDATDVVAYLRSLKQPSEKREAMKTNKPSAAKQ